MAKSDKLERDYQRTSLYVAEGVTFSGTWADIIIFNQQEVKALVKEITESEYWTRKRGWKRIGIDFDNKLKGDICWYDYETRTLVLNSMVTTYVVVHEMAHCLTHKTHDTITPHGSYFAGHYLGLVREIMGEALYKTLKKDFSYFGIKYKES